MNSEQKRILRESITAVRLRNKWAWWELKRQIFDGGYQNWYPAQGDFQPEVERAVGSFSDATRRALVAEWRKSRRSDDDEHVILAHYPALIMEEIVERARLAAYRTIHW